MRFVETPRDMRLFGAALVATTIWRRPCGDDYLAPSCFCAELLTTCFS